MQVWEAKDRNVLYRGKGKMGKAVIKKEFRGENWGFEVWWLFID